MKDVKDINWERQSKFVPNEVPIVEEEKPQSTEVRFPKLAVWSVLGMWFTVIVALAGERIWTLIIQSL